jgi:transcription-repair coupling factor (superfamily II helicase)
MWLSIKALALLAGVSSVVTTETEFIVRLPDENQAGRERVRRRFGRDESIRIGPQFLRLNRRLLADAWAEKLIAVLSLLGDEVMVRK